jgi:hypothetical protein
VAVAGEVEAEPEPGVEVGAEAEAGFVVGPEHAFEIEEVDGIV